MTDIIKSEPSPSPPLTVISTNFLVIVGVIVLAMILLILKNR